MPKSCSVEGCDRDQRCRGWCSVHYQRWWKHGILLLRPRYERCTVDGCEREPRSSTAGLCEMHYYRIRRNGHLEILGTRIEKPSYRAAHSRVATDRGKAREHGCHDCDVPGAHWSFAWKRVSPSGWLWECVNGTTLAYTGSPADYEPRCCSCAHRYDKDFAMQGWRHSAETRREQTAA